MKVDTRVKEVLGVAKNAYSRLASYFQPEEYEVWFEFNEETKNYEIKIYVKG